MKHKFGFVIIRVGSSYTHRCAEMMNCSQPVMSLPLLSHIMCNLLILLLSNSFYWSPTHSFFVSLYISSSFPLFSSCLPRCPVVFQQRLYYFCDSLKINWNGKQHLKGLVKGDEEKIVFYFSSFSKENNPLVTLRIHVQCVCFFPICT